MDEFTKDITRRLLLWQSNDEHSYHEALRLTAAAMADAMGDTYSTQAEAQRYAVMEAFKLYVSEQGYDAVEGLPGGFVSEALTTAVAWVDWFAVADHWIESVREEDAA